MGEEEGAGRRKEEEEEEGGRGRGERRVLMSEEEGRGRELMREELKTVLFCTVHTVAQNFKETSQHFFLNKMDTRAATVLEEDFN